jgi:AraC family transcriptional regulator
VLALHTHERAFFCLVLGGAFSERCGRSTRACSPLTLLFRPAGESHADVFHLETRCFNFELDATRLTGLRKLSAVFDAPTAVDAGTASSVAGRVYREFQNPDALSNLAVEGLMLELAAEFLRDAARPVPRAWLARVHEEIRERFAETVSLPDLARSTGVHPVHLAREFRKHYGCTVGEFVRRLRVERACELLLGSDLPVSEIALACGFFDQSHLSKAFQRLTGVSPARFRESRARLRAYPSR